MNRVKAPLLCPSSRGDEGAIVLGISKGDGLLTYITPRHTVDHDFLSSAGPRPEERFRFSLPCIEGRCGNWSGSHCELIARVFAAAGAESTAPSPLPACSIRSQCQWFSQIGPSACSVCPHVRYPIDRLSETPP